MNWMAVLAQTVETTSHYASDSVVPLDIIWDNITSLGLIEALTFVSFGAVCLLYGWRVFKILVVISFALLGLAIGALIGDKIVGKDSQLWGGLIGMGLLAMVSLPLLRYAVSVLGAVAGGIITSGLWYAMGLGDKYIWAGALIGIIAGGMISFIVFKIAVMLFSSLGGSILMVTGTLALLYLYPQTKDQVEHMFFDSKWFLSLSLIIPTCIGLIVQNKLIQGSKDWSV
jgi:hypothetical protein